MKINVFRLLNDRAQMICTLLGTLSLTSCLTRLPAKGAYAGQQKEVVYCVVQRQETRRLKQIYAISTLVRLISLTKCMMCYVKDSSKNSSISKA
ncbi:DUF2179 domain-containing protein [Paenibacillus sp. 2TAB19]|uniref:DUF2179 domain-containing protein n=1 Tax=Paenibacillus sp. 2TAB19 TaxID=3233003 RepID=UPI003F9D5BBA